jgi:hypothetical protein
MPSHDQGYRQGEDHTLIFWHGRARPRFSIWETNRCKGRSYFVLRVTTNGVGPDGAVENIKFHCTVVHSLSAKYDTYIALHKTFSKLVLKSIIKSVPLYKTETNGDGLG